MSGKTRAQLSEQIEELQKKLEIAEARTFVAPALVRVPEATALAGCIRALDDLPRRADRYGSFDGPDKSTVERLLRSLASKYDINLIEVRTEPCNLLHLTQEKRDQLAFALQGALS